MGITAQSLAVLEGSVTVSQFRLLRTLDGLGTVSCSTLAGALGTSGSSVTRLVDKLEAAGLVRRGSDAHSRSVVTVAVTEAGRDVVGAVLGRRQDLLGHVLDAMGTEERGHAAEAAARFTLLAGETPMAAANAVVAL